MTIGSFLCIVVLVALAATFIVLLVKKWEIDLWMQIHGDELTSRLFGCDFCMSFWAGVICTLVVVMITDSAWVFCIPVFSAPITRYLL